MSQVANWSYNVVCTVWRKGEPDMFGGNAGWNAPEHFMFDISKTGNLEKYVDATGSEFTPAIEWWTEFRAPDGVYWPPIEIGDAVFRGESLDLTPPVGHYIVKGVEAYDANSLGDTRPDYKVVA